MLKKFTILLGMSKRLKNFPEIPSHLLWDMNLEKFDFQKGKAIVAERVAERGNLTDFKTLFSMYGGFDSVRSIYKNEVHHLDKRSFAFICAVFNIKPREMQCYIRKQLREKLLNS